MSSAIGPVLPAIADAFLSAGQGLSQGLAGFRSLTDTLAELAAELDGGSAAATSRDFGRMATRLRRVAMRIAVDAAALGRLIEGNRGLRRRFDDLVGDMRMMVIVSRSARREAVVSPEQRVSVGDFSRTIDQQIGAVQARLDGCAVEHGKFTELLEQGARGRRAFEEAHGGRIEALAADLDAALVALGDRRERGLALMGEAGRRAGAITASAGLAIVSPQIGDTTRQRLEHVSVALERAEAAAAGAPSLAAEAAAILDALGRGNAKIDGVLAGVEHTGRDFDAAMAELTRAMSAVVAETVRLADAADRIDAASPAPTPSEAAAQAVDDLMLPLYSMTQERDVHAAIVDAQRNGEPLSLIGEAA